MKHRVSIVLLVAFAPVAVVCSAMALSTQKRNAHISTRSCEGRYDSPSQFSGSTNMFWPVLKPTYPRAILRLRTENATP